MAINLLNRVEVSSSRYKLEAKIEVAQKLINNGYLKKFILNIVHKRRNARKTRGMINKDQVNESLPPHKRVGLTYIRGCTRGITSSCKNLQFVSKNGIKISNLAKHREKNSNEDKKLEIVYKIPLTYGDSYVGQSSTRLKVRLREHLYNIRSPASNLAQHIKECNCSIIREQIRILEAEKDYQRSLAHSFHKELH